MIITVFGSSVPNATGYEEAYELGKLIGAKAHVLKNGGYGGTMEASAKGCREAGGEVIGVCVKGHRIDRTGQPNEYNSTVIITEDVTQRIQEMLNCDLVVVLKGNVGTLEEMFVAWVHAIESDSNPIIVVGPQMKGLLDYLVNNSFLKEEHFRYVKFVPSIYDIVI
jgi:hypothetical protein